MVLSFFVSFGTVGSKKRRIFAITIVSDPKPDSDL
jgi:hypothetical protein